MVLASTVDADSCARQPFPLVSHRSHARRLHLFKPVRHRRDSHYTCNQSSIGRFRFEPWFSSSLYDDKFHGRSPDICWRDIDGRFSQLRGSGCSHLDRERDVLFLCMFWQYRPNACTICPDGPVKFDWKKTRWDVSSRLNYTPIAKMLISTGKAGETSFRIGKGVRVFRDRAKVISIQANIAMTFCYHAQVGNGNLIWITG